MIVSRVNTARAPWPQLCITSRQISFLPVAPYDISHIMRFCLSSSGSYLSPYTAVLIAARIVISQPLASHDGIFSLDIPKTALGASMKHDPSFVSFSFEPAFWVEFFGNSSSPNKLAFDLLGRIVDHGGQPTVWFPQYAYLTCAHVFSRFGPVALRWTP